MVDSVTCGSVLKKTYKLVGVAFIAAVVFFMPACKASAQTINSAVALKEYLDKQPANTPDKPIKVTMNANGPMLKGITDAINSAGKYVSLDLTGSPLTEIPDYAFYDKTTKKGCVTLAEIIMPRGITEIGLYAFSGSSLTSVIIPDSVTCIWDEAFRGCNLTKIIIPDSVEQIGNKAFSGCTSLTSIALPNNDYITICNDAFRGCTSLTSITLPKSVGSIDSGAFVDCTNLTSVTFQGYINLGREELRYGYINYISSFDGDLDTKYQGNSNSSGIRSGGGGAGTYKTTAPVGNNSKWTKQ
jgi:hypothetical protein